MSLYSLHWSGFSVTAWHKANSRFAFWNFLEFFPQNIFNQWLVESKDTKPMGMEG